MIVCTDCGARNEDGESFCGECGAYLEWDGERVGDAPEPAAEPATAPPVEPLPAEPQPAGLLQRVKGAVGIGEHTSPSSPSTASPSQSEPAPVPAPEPVPVAASAAPSAASPGVATPPDVVAPDALTPGDGRPGPPDMPAAAPSAPAGPGSQRAGGPRPQSAPSAPARPSPAASAPAASAPLASAPAAMPVRQPTQQPAQQPVHQTARRPTQQPPQQTVQQPARRPTQQPVQPPAVPAMTAAPGTAAVRPGTALPKPRRRELPPEDRPPAPGESICGACGAGNAASRKFCRSCGADLADAPVAAALPWWRRLFHRSPRAEAVAGTRRKRRKQRRFPRFVVPIAVLAALVVAAVLTKPQWDPLYQRVVDHVKGTKTAEPVRVSATSSAARHPATLLRDGATNAFWAPAATGRRAVGQQVVFAFASPIRLVDIRVFNGAAANLAQYLKRSSPQMITVTVRRKDKDPYVMHVTLDDSPGDQEIGVAQSDVVGVKIGIASVNRPRPGKLVAVGEVEFLVRK